MATTYTLVPIPIWLSFDLVGVSAGGAQLFSWESIDKTQPKAIFQDPAGNLPYTNPIDFNENGEAPGPFFFADDTAYFLQLCEPAPAGSAPGTQGPLIWQIDGYGPGISGGGGGPITINENLFVTNLITNGAFYYNLGSSDNPIGSTDLVLAPSNHDIYKPDIRLVKTNLNAIDQITFPEFYPSQPNALVGDVTPEYYLQYSCSNSPASETQKCIQFPICKHVQNLNNQLVTYSFWAKGISGTQTLTVFIYQDYGNGGSPSVVPPLAIQTFNLTNAWAQYSGTFTIPGISGLTVGTCGNDGLYFQIGFPLGAPTTTQFTKVELYLGDIDPTSASSSPDFDSYDEVDALTNSPRTGDIRTSMNSFQPFGWVPMNDGTIGSVSSNATTRANKDTFQLYSLLWNAMSTNATTQSYAPLFSAAGASASYGANAIADFDANKQMALIKSLGQVLAGTQTALPINPSQVYTANFTTGILTLTTSSMSMPTGTPVTLTNAGGAVPAGLALNTIYYTIYQSATTIKLAASIANAFTGTAVAFSDNGTGTNTVSVYSDTLGQILGERLLVSSHTHALSVNSGVTGVPAGHPSYETAYSTNGGGSGTGYIVNGTAGTQGINPLQLSGRTEANNNPQSTNLQPSTWMNVFIKL